MGGDGDRQEQRSYVHNVHAVGGNGRRAGDRPHRAPSMLFGSFQREKIWAGEHAMSPNHGHGLIEVQS